jgi:hypothetical protein
MIRHIPETLFIYHCHDEQKTKTFELKDWTKEEDFVKGRAEEGVSFVQN